MNASPLARRKKLEDTVESRIADVFFSLHLNGDKEALYVSEVSEKATVSIIPDCGAIVI
jgi:3'-phosphoadenosine 5'-phosphosulfate sulfotransferase